VDTSRSRIGLLEPELIVQTRDGYDAK